MCVKKYYNLLLLLPMLLVMGCSKQPKEPIVAQIGPYEMLVSDYKREARKLSYTEKKSLENLAGKNAFLDQLIDREVLIQQAQEMDIDKEKSFMQKIEDFWEEALLEELVRKKSKDILAKVYVTDKEIDTYYESMKRKVYARVIVTEKESLAKEWFANEPLLKSKEKLTEAKKDTGWQWFMYEQINYSYRDIMYSLKPGEKKIILKQNKGYFLFVIDRYEDRKIDSKPDIKENVKKAIREEKELSAIDDWIGYLRMHTRILIDEEVLGYLEV